MQTITTQTKEKLSQSLYSYYDALREGELKSLSSLMTKTSYITLIKALGFKQSFKDSEFKQLLKKSGEDKSSLKVVEAVLSSDLRAKVKQYEITLVSFEEKGSQRITVHYTEDRHAKKVYFSSTSGDWQIDYNAGRRTT